MGLFYKVSNKQLLKDRNTIFKQVGVPTIESQGFVKSPFKGTWHGQYCPGLNCYIYEYTRLTNENQLQNIQVYINNGEKWIQIFLNIFELSPKIYSIAELNNLDGIKFGLPPNSKSEMRLRCHEYKGPPILYMFLQEHKIGRYFTKSGYERQINKLQNLIKVDLENIDLFIKRWHELHTPNKTDWYGNAIGEVNTQIL